MHRQVDFWENDVCGTCEVTNENMYQGRAIPNAGTFSRFGHWE